MLKSYLNESKIHPAPLAVFRILFGSLMLIALIRFWANGWIHTLYIEPEFHFKYYGFSWVTDFGNYTYLLYVICIISSIGIILGYRYKLSIFLFFLLLLIRNSLIKRPISIITTSQAVLHSYSVFFLPHIISP